MKISTGTWNTISKLFDEALDLEPGARTIWLEQLQIAEPQLASLLQELLAAHATSETADVLAALPSIEDLTGASAEQKGQLGLNTGDRVGPYLLKREVGAGGMADVWLAERADGAFARDVALKLPRITRLRRDLAIRFARERDILARLEHPHIARLYDAGVTDDGLPYLAMEFVDGQAITDYCDTQRMPIKARLELFAQVLDAVQFAHANLIIHRDLKPSNIIVGNDGRVRLLDFGIAKLLADDESIAETQLTQLSGRALTPDYASPEQIKGEPLTTASDVYSLGVILYELLTGKRPYRLKLATPAQLEQAIIDSDPMPPSARMLQEAINEDRREAKRRAKVLGGDLDTITMKALQKKTAARYTSAAELALELKRHLAFEPIQAKRESGWYAFEKFVLRNRLAVFGATALIASLSIGVIGTVWQAQQARESARLATVESKKAIAVQQFLLGMFRANSEKQSDPVKARATTARELLDIGARRVELDLKDVPEAQDEVLNTLADMYLQVGLNDSAADMFDKRIQLIRRSSDSNHIRLLEALLKYAQAISYGPPSQQFRKALDEARMIVDTTKDVKSELRSALAWLESVYFKGFSLSRMQAAVNESVSIAENNPGVESQDFASALRSAANASLIAGDPQTAESLSLRAISKIGELKTGQEPWRVSQLITLSDTRHAQLRIDEAERDVRTAVEISQRINGATHSMTIYSSSYFAHFLTQTGRPLEAQKVIGDVRTTLSSMGAAARVDQHRLVDRISAEISLDCGLPGQGLNEIDRTIKFLEEKRMGPGSRVSIERIRAEALIGVGRGEEANELMQRVLAEADEFFDGAAHPSMRNSFLLTTAKAQVAVGNKDRAIETLKKMQPPKTASTMPFVPDLLRSSLVQAGILIKAGDPEKALMLSLSVRDVLSSSPLRKYFLPILADSIFIVAQAERAIGSNTSCATLQEARIVRGAIDDPTSIRLAGIDQQVSSCKSSSHQTKR